MLTLEASLLIYLLSYPRLFGTSSDYVCGNILPEQWWTVLISNSYIMF